MLNGTAIHFAGKPQAVVYETPDYKGQSHKTDGIKINHLLFRKVITYFTNNVFVV